VAAVRPLDHRPRRRAQPRPPDRRRRRQLSGWTTAARHRRTRRVAGRTLWQRRASSLATVDRRYDHNALIVADLSNDATYAEVLVEAFGTRVIGLQISRSGDGLNDERRPVGTGVMFVYTIGRSQLLEHFHAELQSDVVRFVDGPMSQKAYQQLMNLEAELRDTGVVYKCLPGQHDDLGISCAMLAWAARHPHLQG
jgi:hypothetical protein